MQRLFTAASSAYRRYLARFKIRNGNDRETRVLVQLQCIVYGYIVGEECPPADTAVVRAVQQLPALRRIELRDITLTDTVTLLPQLQKVTLDNVWSAHFILPSLLQCTHLTSLDIIDLLAIDCEVLASVLPQLPHLQYIHYGRGYAVYKSRRYRCGSGGHAVVVSALQHLTQLTHIELWYIDLGDAGTLLITPHMTQLQTVKLVEVKMSDRRWTEFVSSLLRVQHKVIVTLMLANSDTVNIIHDSPHCTVIEEKPWSDEVFHTLKFIAEPPAL